MADHDITPTEGFPTDEVERETSREILRELVAVRKALREHTTAQVEHTKLVVAIADEAKRNYGALADRAQTLHHELVLVSRRADDIGKTQATHHKYVVESLGTLTNEVTLLRGDYQAMTRAVEAVGTTASTATTTAATAKETAEGARKTVTSLSDADMAHELEMQRLRDEHERLVLANTEKAKEVAALQETANAAKADAHAAQQVALDAKKRAAFTIAKTVGVLVPGVILAWEIAKKVFGH